MSPATPGKPCYSDDYRDHAVLTPRADRRLIARQAPVYVVPLSQKNACA